MSYGIPYRGSKNEIANDLMSILLASEVFIDMFGGGASMMHKAILSNKYKKCIYNDLSKDIYLTVKSLSNNDFTRIDHFIGRKEFYSSTDLFIRTIFSFKNNRVDYFCSKEKEKYQKLMFNCYVLDDWKEAKSLYGKNYKLEIAHIEKKYRFHVAGQINRLLIFQKDLQCTGIPISLFNTCYDKVTIPKNSLIYCDPPYIGTSTTGYAKNKFDYDKFYEWALAQKNIYISEYTMPNDFIPIFTKNKRSKMVSDNSKIVIEKLFVPRLNYDEATQGIGLFK
jgi:site-specific DNA-adenine methylase